MTGSAGMPANTSKTNTWTLPWLGDQNSATPSSSGTASASAGKSSKLHDPRGSLRKPTGTALERLRFEPLGDDLAHRQAVAAEAHAAGAERHLQGDRPGAGLVEREQAE